MTLTDTDLAKLGEPQKFRIARDGDRDFRFRGWRLGEGSHGTGGNSGFNKDWTRGTVVKVYLTTGGNFVVAVRQWSRWQGETDRYRAECLRNGDQPAALLEWLRHDSTSGELGPASKEAWEEACKSFPALAVDECEEVD